MHPVALTISPAALDPGGPDASGMMSGFMVIFVLVFLASIGIAIFKFSQTRQMAMKKGATEGEATAIALSGDLATAATFLKGESPKSAEERIREVRSLQQQGLINAEQADQRVQEILRGV